MLVALEALKESVVYLVYDIREVQSKIDAQTAKIGSNYEQVWTNMSQQERIYTEIVELAQHMQESCRHTEMDIDVYRSMLTLYC